MNPYLNLSVKLGLALIMASTAICSTALAEGSLGSDMAKLNATRPIYRVITPKVTDAGAATPEAPIPYGDYKTKTAPARVKTHPAKTKPGIAAAKPVAAKAAVPQPAPLPPPIVINPAPISLAQPLQEQPMYAPPPQPPHMMAPPAPTHISLRCETKTTEGKRLVSHGSFYIDLFPSPVFPDTQADFQFLFVDPAHNSLIRDSECLDKLCSANVTGTAYYLLNRVTRKGAALRLTLDRSKGAFYAEEIGTNGRKSDGAHRGEQGYCTPQTLPSTLF